MATLNFIRERCLARTEEQKAEFCRSIERMGAHNSPPHAPFRDPLSAKNGFIERYHHNRESHDARKAAELAAVWRSFPGAEAPRTQGLARELATQLRALSSLEPAAMAYAKPEEPFLRIWRSPRRVCIRGVEFGVGVSVHKLLRLLAEAAVQGSPWVSLDDLKSKLLCEQSGEKALGQLIFRARKALVRALCNAAVANLIENDHGVGYRLNLPAATIRVEN